MKIKIQKKIALAFQYDFTSNNLVMVNRYTYDLIFSALGTRSLLEKHRVCFLMMDFKQSV